MSVRMQRICSFTGIVLGFFIALLDTTIINVVLPEMTKHFGGTVSHISWIMNGYNLAFAVFILTASRLADQFGRKKVFIAGVTLFTVSSLLAGFASSLEILIALRVIQGLAGAVIVPVTIPLTTTTFSKEMHGTIIGIWGAVSGVAAASGPALGGIITQHLNWQWIFFVNVPLGLLSIVLTVLFIRESRDESATRTINYAGIIGISGSMFFITYALLNVQDYGWDSGRTLLLLAAGMLFLVFFIFWQLKAREPLMPLSLLRIRTFVCAVLAILIVGAALMNLSFLTSFYLIRMMGMTELKSGLLLSALALGSIISSAISGPLSAKYGSHWFAVFGIALMAGATYSMSGLHADSSQAEVILRLAIAGVGTGFTLAPVMSSAARNVPEEKVGISSGLINMAKALGSVIGVAIIVTVLQSHMNHGQQEAVALAQQSIQEDAELQPFLRTVLAEAAGSMSRAMSNNGSTAGISAAVMEQVEQAAAQLSPSDLKAFAADRDNQVREAELQLAQAGDNVQEAAEQAFSRTYAFASILMLPGIFCALFSDRRQYDRRSERVNAASPPQTETDILERS